MTKTTGEPVISNGIVGNSVFLILISFKIENTTK